MVLIALRRGARVREAWCTRNQQVETFRDFPVMDVSDTVLMMCSLPSEDDRQPHVRVGGRIFLRPRLQR